MSCINGEWTADDRHVVDADDRSMQCSCDVVDMTLRFEVSRLDSASNIGETQARLVMPWSDLILDDKETMSDTASSYEKNMLNRINMV